MFFSPLLYYHGLPENFICHLTVLHNPPSLPLPSFSFYPFMISSYLQEDSSYSLSTLSLSSSPRKLFAYLLYSVLQSSSSLSITTDLLSQHRISVSSSQCILFLSRPCLLFVSSQSTFKFFFLFQILAPVVGGLNTTSPRASTACSL
jgi:hypothetical protein